MDPVTLQIFANSALDVIWPILPAHVISALQFV